MWSAEDEKELFGGARLMRLGGHFPGSAVLHWSKGADGKGILCTGVALYYYSRSPSPDLTAMTRLPACPACHLKRHSGLGMQPGDAESAAGS